MNWFWSCFLHRNWGHSLEIKRLPKYIRSEIHFICWFVVNLWPVYSLFLRRFVSVLCQIWYLLNTETGRKPDKKDSQNVLSAIWRKTHFTGISCSYPWEFKSIPTNKDEESRSHKKCCTHACTDECHYHILLRCLSVRIILL